MRFPLHTLQKHVAFHTGTATAARKEFLEPGRIATDGLDAKNARTDRTQQRQTGEQPPSHPLSEPKHKCPQTYLKLTGDK
jgi:hypothetical protein